MLFPRTLAYYGWYVLAASAVTEMLVMGATSYSAGLFVLPLQAEFHLSRADASSSVLILYFGAAFFAPLVGRILDHYPIRLVISGAALIFSTALAAIALTGSVWIILSLLLLPAAFGYTALGPLTTATLASRWFYRRRGLAMGFAAVSTSGGGFIVVPLLSIAIQHFGWRLALFCEALAIGVSIVLLALLVIRDSPLRMGLGDDLENRGRPESAPNELSANKKLGWKDILIKPAFWIPSLSLATISGTSQAVVSTLVPYGVGLGINPINAALLISAFAIAAGTTKVCAGLMADYLNPRVLLIMAALAMMLSWLTFLFFTSYWFLLVGSCLAGIALGCALPTVGTLIATEFGSAQFGAVIGWTYALIFTFAIISVRFTGYIYDSLGSYRVAFEVFACILGFLAVAAFVFAMKGRRLKVFSG